MVYVTAVFEAVNEFESNIFPSLHNRKEGTAASSTKFCVATEAGAAGVVFLLLSIGKPPRPRVSGGFAIFINRSAPPPCVGARRGICSIRSQLDRPPLQFKRSSLSKPVSAFSAALFKQTHRTDRDPPLDRLTHIVQRQGRDGNGRQRFHLYSRFSFCFGNALNSSS